MTCRLSASVVFCLLTISVFASVANAQSRDQDKPTPLNSGVISSTLSPENNGQTFYYSFVAGPGDVRVTLTVEAIDNVVQAGFAIFDESEVQLTRKFATTYRGNSSQAVENVYLKRRQRVVLSVILQNNSGSGRYRFHIGGAVDFGKQDESPGIRGDTPTDTMDPAAHTKCLPKYGTLIVKMKDGSKKIIDLSEADTITFVP